MPQLTPQPLMATCHHLPFSSFDPSREGGTRCGWGRRGWFWLALQRSRRRAPVRRNWPGRRMV